MPTRKHRGYPYDLEGSIGSQPGIRRRPVKKKGSGGLVFLVFSILVLAASGVYFIFALKSPSGPTSFTPLAKQLLAIRFEHNGKEVILTPDSQCVVNPKDTLQFLEIKTDGWLTWGTKLVSNELDVGVIEQKAMPLKDIWPKETFENPKLVEFVATSWNKPIGKVSFLIQLDARDWLQKANNTADIDRKISYLEKAIQENSGNVLAKTQLASLYFESKKYNEAVKLYKEVEESGKSKAIQERLLTVYQVQNRVDEALDVYLDLLKLSEDREFFKEFLHYLQKHKSKEETGKFLEKHQAEIPKAFQSSMLLMLADLNTQTKNWSKAAASYEKAIRAGVKDPDVLYNLAVTYQQSDDPDKAIGALERYLQRNPNDMKSWFQLADLQEKKGAISQARNTYETIVQKNPQNKEALLKLVNLLEKSKDSAGLQSAYEKLAQLQPKNRTVQFNLAVLYYEGKKWDKAAETFEAIAEQDPKDLESRKYLLDLYRKQKDKDNEYKMLRNLSQLEPNNTAYYDSLFASYDEKKDYKAIINLFSDAVQHNPDSVQYNNYLLYGYVKQGDTKGAMKPLENLIRLQPKEKKHLRQAAKLYEGTGDYDGALKKLDLLLKLDPQDKQAKDDYMRIKMLMLPKKKPS